MSQSSVSSRFVVVRRARKGVYGLPEAVETALATGGELGVSLRGEMELFDMCRPG